MSLIDPNARTTTFRKRSPREHASSYRAAHQPRRAALAAGVSGRLPELLDVKALRAELGVSRAAAEAIMRQLPVVQIEGLRKTFVRRGDVARYLDARTFSKDEVPL